MTTERLHWVFDPRLTTLTGAWAPTYYAVRPEGEARISYDQHTQTWDVYRAYCGTRCTISGGHRSIGAAKRSARAAAMRCEL